MATWPTVSRPHRRPIWQGAAELTLAECAILAGLPQAPALYDPLTNPEAAKERQLVVLNLMVKYGAISQAQADQAYAERCNTRRRVFQSRLPIL